MLRLLLAAQAPLWEKARRQQGEWLSAQEAARLEEMRAEWRRREFLACRYGLRAVLSDGDTQLSDWRLSADFGRAPGVLSCGNGRRAFAEGLFLSLTHSRGYLMCACAPYALGVDMELIPFRRPGDALDRAHFFCSEHEFQALLSRPQGAARMEAFCDYWVLKEAFFKLVGTGLDFGKIKRITCQPAGALENSMKPLGHAWLWKSECGSGGKLVCALCTFREIEPQEIEFLPHLRNGVTLDMPQKWALVE
ncbi:MAG: 4'-phosphopantetheinyl transferase superfamily protein [Ottowia sp.]|nr:4'-phosphopantetheinyl transferase superfamily protein [Ottowia sp.]